MLIIWPDCSVLLELYKAVVIKILETTSQLGLLMLAYTFRSLTSVMHIVQLGYLLNIGLVLLIHFHEILLVQKNRLSKSLVTVKLELGIYIPLRLQL